MKCEKRKLEKVEGVCKTYGELMYKGADHLVSTSEVEMIKVNVPIKNPSGDYTTDFYCEMRDGTVKVFECVERNKISLTCKKMIRLLDESRNYWLRRGAKWGIITNAKEK